MTTLSASTTLNTGYKITSDTTGTLVFQTGSSPTTAVTIGTDQNVTLVGNITLNNGAADGAQLTLASSGYSNWNWDNYSGRLRAYYNTTEYFTIDTSGNVGIGTNAPTQKLDIVGAVYSGTESNFVGPRIYNSADGGDATIKLQNSTKTAYIRLKNNYDGTWLKFDDGTNARMVIDGSGNVLIGSTSVGYARFETVRADTGNVGVGRFYASAASGYTGETLQVIAAQAGGTGFNLLACYFANGAAYAFKVRGDGTIYAQNTTVQSASDVRFKENIVDSTEGLDVVSALRPVRFDIKEGHGVSAKTNQLGFIAQEVKAVFPDAVDVWGESDDPENPYLSLGSAALIPVLVKAIQEQQAIIQQLTARIETLEAK